jgi:class 3 adenylate cyclase
MEGATRHAVEHAHEKDLNIQDEYGVEIKTYWFDEERGHAFCLIEAPNIDAVKDVHGAAHGSIPHEIIEVDSNLVESFLGKIKDPVADGRNINEPETDSPFRTIMFTDLMDSTATTNRLGDKKAMHLLRIHNAFTRNAIREHRGLEVKHTGDGFMISFVSAIDAVNCAISIQQAFSAYNEEEPDEKMLVRIGLSAGEPVQEDGDLFGTTVQLAARLCGAAAPGGILTAEIVHSECPKGQFDFKYFDSSNLKGFDQSIPMYEILW